MKNLNNLEIEFQELSDNELETVVGGTLKHAKKTSYCAPPPCPPPAPVCNPCNPCNPCGSGYGGSYN